MLNDSRKFVVLYCYSYSIRLNIVSGFSVKINEQYLSHYLQNQKFKEDNEITLESNWYFTKQEALVSIMDKINNYEF